jgi:hypothetical protein
MRNGLRASVESYSIKRLEPFYDFERGTPLDDANVALANLQANLELGDVPSVSDETKATVRAYDEDDCRSASTLRDSASIWLNHFCGKTPSTFHYEYRNASKAHFDRVEPCSCQEAFVSAFCVSRSSISRS